MPLLFLPLSFGEGQVLKLVLDIRLPGDIVTVDIDFDARIVLESEGIVEETLSDKTAGIRGLVRNERRGIIGGKHTTEVLVTLDRVAVVQLVNWKIVAHQLLVGARLDVTAMVLIEVVQLVVDVDGRLDVTVNL